MTELDLNLLRVFEALALERSATRAGRRLGLSQPAVSHALDRLREQLGDPLFVRAVGGMVPTPRALELEPLVRDVLARAARLTEGERFDPATCDRRFRIATTDYFEYIALPRLAATLAAEAPRVTLISRPSGTELPRAELAEGELHLAIAGFYADVPEGFYQQRLFSERFVCVVRCDHPTVGSRLSLAQYTRLSHVLISPSGDLRGVVDELLEARCRRRHVAVAASSFLSAGWIVAGSDLVLTAPRRLALAYQRSLPLRIVRPPMAVPGFTVRQIWHERYHADPAHRWLRQRIAEACAAAD